MLLLEEGEHTLRVMVKSEIFDYTTAVEEGKIPEGYWVWWGYEDQSYLKMQKKS